MSLEDREQEAEHYESDDDHTLRCQRDGRLLGAVLSGWIYQIGGLTPCLVVSGGPVRASVLVSTALPRQYEAADGFA